MDTIIIRPATDADRADIRRLMREFYGPTSTEKHLDIVTERRLHPEGPASLFLAEADGKPVALANVAIDEPNAEPVISDLFTQEAWRGQGIASRLMTHCEDWSRAQGKHETRLHVAASNDGARHLYEAKGYTTYFNFVGGMMGETAVLTSLTARPATENDWPLLARLQDARGGAILKDWRQPAITAEHLDFYTGGNHAGQRFFVVEANGNPVSAAHFTGYETGEGVRGQELLALFIDPENAIARALADEGRMRDVLEAISARMAQDGLHMPYTAAMSDTDMNLFRQNPPTIELYAMKKTLE